MPGIGMQRLIGYSCARRRRRRREARETRHSGSDNVDRTPDMTTLHRPDRPSNRPRASRGNRGIERSRIAVRISRGPDRRFEQRLEPLGPPLPRVREGLLEGGTRHVFCGRSVAQHARNTCRHRLGIRRPDENRALAVTQHLANRRHVRRNDRPSRSHVLEQFEGRRISLRHGGCCMRQHQHMGLLETLRDLLRAETSNLLGCRPQLPAGAPSRARSFSAGGRRCQRGRPEARPALESASTPSTGTMARIGHDGRRRLAEANRRVGSTRTPSATVTTAARRQAVPKLTPNASVIVTWPSASRHTRASRPLSCELTWTPQALRTPAPASPRTRAQIHAIRTPAAPDRPWKAHANDATPRSRHDDAVWSPTVPRRPWRGSDTPCVAASPVPLRPLVE